MTRLLVQLDVDELAAVVSAAVERAFDARGITTPAAAAFRAHLSSKEAAAELGCSERHVRTLVNQGRLRAAKLVPGKGSSRVRITRASIERLLRESLK